MAYRQQARAVRPTTVEVLDELGRLLPDSTYLEKVSIEGDQILLIGQSSEASALVGQLGGSKLWRSPALTGALQPDPRSGRDRFTMTAQLAIDNAPANTPADTPVGMGAADARSQPCPPPLAGAGHPRRPAAAGLPRAGASAVGWSDDRCRRTYPRPSPAATSRAHGAARGPRSET